MYNPASLAILLLILCLHWATPARAQSVTPDALPRFDCAALLAATGLGDTSAKTRQRLSAAPLRFIWAGDASALDRSAPIVLTPLRTGITARLARADPLALEDGVLSCTLIGVAFRPGLDAETSFEVQDLRGGPRPADLPLLLLGRHEDEAAADRAFSAWVTRGYPIPVDFPDPVKEPIGTGQQIFGDHRAFLPMPLLGETRWSEANILALNPDRAPQDTQIFLRSAGLDEAGVILALCGTGDCADLRAATPTGAPDPNPTPSRPPEAAAPLVGEPSSDAKGPETASLPDPAPSGAGDTPPVPSSQTSSSSPSDPNANPSDTASPVDPPRMAPTQETTPPEATATTPTPPVKAPALSPRPEERAPPSRGPAPVPLRLTYVNVDGREDDLPPDLARRLDCVLFAIGADIFTETPACPDRAFAALKDRRARIHPVSDDHWQIVAGAQDRAPNAILVTLPAGQSGAACRMDLEYDGPDGTRARLELNPVAGAMPAQFTAVPQIPIPVRDGRVQVYLAVSAEAACGAPSRAVEIPTAPVLSLALSEEARINRAALHVVAMDAGDLDVTLGFDPAERQRLATQILGAVESAQARLAASWGDDAWALSSVGVARLDETEGLVSLLALPSDALRRGAATRFATIPAAERADLGEMRPRLTPTTLASSLTAAVRDAAERGVTHLSLNLIAPVTPRTAVALSDPCADRRFASLLDDLAAPGAQDGPEISLTVFPLVRLRPEDTPDLSAFQPLSFDPDAPSRPGGLTRCLSSGDKVTTYPFFIEPWRPDGDIAGRYAAALADRLALHMMTQLTEDTARP
ncbi:MAG: hypothetical protein AAGF79_06115 [Pseudomonadota bacterium]